MTDTDISKLNGPGSAAAFKAWYEGDQARHAAGLADGSVDATGAPYGLPFSGQRNFGGIGAAPGTLPSFGVTCSDGFRHAFAEEADAEAFIRRYGRKAEAA